MVAFAAAAVSESGAGSSDAFLWGALGPLVLRMRLLLLLLLVAAVDFCRRMGAMLSRP